MDNFNFKEELSSLRARSLDKLARCSPEDETAYSNLIAEGKPLPKGIIRLENSFSGDKFYIENASIPQNDIFEFLLHKQLAQLKTIKKCALFFTVLAIIVEVAGLIWLLSFLFLI